MACSMRLNGGLWPYNPCIIREGKKRRTRIAWPWASSLIPVCRVRNVPRGDMMDMCIHTVGSWPRSWQEWVEREEEEERDWRRNKKEKERKKKKEKKRNKRDANSLLHREHGHDVKAKEGMRYIRAIRSPPAAECQCFRALLGIQAKNRWSLAWPSR